MEKVAGRRLRRTQSSVPCSEFFAIFAPSEPLIDVSRSSALVDVSSTVSQPTSLPLHTPDLRRSSSIPGTPSGTCTSPLAASAASTMASGTSTASQGLTAGSSATHNTFQQLGNAQRGAYAAERPIWSGLPLPPPAASTHAPGTSVTFIPSPYIASPSGQLPPAPKKTSARGRVRQSPAGELTFVAYRP